MRRSRVERNGAQEKTRTSTVLLPLGPEPSASTNSATWALLSSTTTLQHCVVTVGANYKGGLSPCKALKVKNNRIDDCHRQPF